MPSIVSCTLRILCVIYLVKSILTDESSEGRCPHVTGPPNFSLNMLQGHWYGVKQINFDFTRCFEAFAQSPVERNLTFYFLLRDESGAEVQQKLIDIAYPNDPSRADAYLINNGEAQFWGTWVHFYADYDSCFGAEKCDESTGSDGKYRHNVTIAICCRNSQPSDEVLNSVFDKMKRQGLGTYKMKDFDQENCSK